MAREITRRDFVGSAVAGLVAGSAGLSLSCGPDTTMHAKPAVGPVGAAAGAPRAPSSYPPLRSGLRGSHEGAFEVAHQMAFEGRSDWAPVAVVDTTEYDLVVVGAGVSGLAAAYFYRKAHPEARILLIENHDDFGGHAKRNEFRVGDRTVLGYGGSQSLEAPGAYSDVAMGLLRELGVETQRLHDAYDADFFRRNGLAAAVYFDRDTYGVDRLVRTDFLDPSLFMPIAPAGVSNEEAIAAMPLSEDAQKELLTLINLSEDRLPEQSIFSEPEFLRSISYRDFLVEHLGVREPQVLGLLQHVTDSYFGHGIDAVPALDAILAFGLPGLGGTGLASLEGLSRKVIGWITEPYFYHFPDGNASVPRLLVRALIPGVADGSTMEDVVTADFDYTHLDRAENAVRLRLDSTVVRVEHDGSPKSAQRVFVTYVRHGASERVRTKKVVLACYNMVIPHLVPELPAGQRAALRELVKIPLVYTSVLLRTGEAWKKLGLGMAYCPGSWHRLAMLDFPVSIPGYRYGSSLDEPIVVHMQRCPTRPGFTPQEQSRAGRIELLTTRFEDIERGLRIQLTGMLGAGGFDAARDIEAITVNRWPHGYAFEQNELFGADEIPPYERGRVPFGRIAIANSDAGGRAYLDAAIDEAWRAVGELS